MHDWDNLPGTSDANNMQNDIEKCMTKHNKPDMFDLYAVEDVPISPVKKGKKSIRGRVSKSAVPRNTTKKSERRSVSRTGRGRRKVQYVLSPLSMATNENIEPMQNDELDSTELSSKSDTLSSKDVINKVSVEFTKCLPYDILQLRPTLAENYEKAKASDYFLNSK